VSSDTTSESQDMDITLSVRSDAAHAGGVDPVRVLRGTRLTVRRAVDLVRCASALCSNGR